tara:strand:- start:205 stop:336 length:132 start_codon:yes stop_codon:yes gene_type:complete
MARYMEAITEKRDKPAVNAGKDISKYSSRYMPPKTPRRIVVII